MTDNGLIQLFLPLIKAGLIADGFLNVVTVAANQPTQQGINRGPTVYFYKIDNRPIGYPKWIDVWDEENSQMVHTESQYMECTFQVSALVLQNPTTPNAYTASDLVNEVRAILQSQNTVVTLNNSGVGILRIAMVTNVYFPDDRDQFEAHPSFEFTLKYLDDRVSTSPIITLPVEFDLVAV